MNGIFGVFNRNGCPVDDWTLRRMQSSFPCHQAEMPSSWKVSSIGLGVGSRAAPDSIRESMPAISRSGQQVLISSARLDNREELFRRLNVPVADQMGTTDSELILLTYEKWGTECPRYLLGDWAFGLWDVAEQRLFIARDQYGHAPLYFFQNHQMFVFGSTIKAVLAGPGVPHELNPQCLLELTPGYRRDETTAYRGVLKLTPGRSMTIAKRHLTQEQYWHPRQAPDIRLRRDDDYVEAFRDIYSEAVRCRLQRGNRVGVTLSGGLDSGSVAAFAAQHLKLQGQRLTAFTSVPLFDTLASDSPTQFGDERPYVEDIREHCRSIDVRYVTAAEVSPLQGIRRFLEASSDPSVSASNAFWLCGIMAEAKRLGIDTLLTGQAGNYTVSWGGNRDEYLGSLLRKGRLLEYASEVFAWKRTHQVSLMKTLTNQIARSILPAQWIRKRKRRHAERRTNPLNQSFLNSVKLSEPGRSDDPGLDTVHGASAHRKMFALMKTDNNAAWGELGLAYGINVTAPTIDVRVIEFCLGIPQDQYTRDGQRKLLIRRAMKGRLPDSVLWNERKGRQAGDIIHRIREHRDEFHATLSELRSSSLAAETLDLPGMTSVFDRLQTDANRNLSHDAVQVLLRGLMVGLFLQRFDSPQESSVSRKNAA